MDGSNDPDFMLSLARGLAVLRAFEGVESLSVAEAARAAALSRSSAGRCLHTMERLGYLVARDGRFALTAATLPLCGAFLLANPVARAGQSIANQLRDQLQETVSLGMLDPADPGRLVYVSRAEKNQVMASPLAIGSTLRSDCTAMGRVLLSALDENLLEAWLKSAKLVPATPQTMIDKDGLRALLTDVRHNRWSMVDGELSPGLRSLAVPVRDRDGRVIAALNVATFSHSHSPESLIDSLLPELRAAAAQLERLG